MTELTIAAPIAADKPDWRRLYEGYATFYKMPMTDAIADRVWSWIQDPGHVLEALVVRTAAGRVVGLAHFRAMPRPLTGTTAGFLDDLFVDPEFRGGRVGERLLLALRDLARERGWTVIRWLTADDNFRARTLYDRVAKRTMWITYQMDL
ncbi:MAG TPA: GNAT family N-acetyltransferase [Stellaceae bacterium]|nr:GNAT family N-acetyltransferase [Stellaceae bacterium]